jgi:SnoaL-like protein
VGESKSEFVLRGFSVFNEKGPEAWLELVAEEDRLHPEFVFRIQEDLPNGGEWRGVEGFREANRHWLEAWDEFSITPLEVTEGPGGDLLMQVEQHAVARGSGMEISGSGFFYAILYRGEQIAEMHLMTDRERAARLVGLDG